MNSNTGLLPQAVNKAFTVTWYLLEPIVCYLISPPISFHSVNKETTWKKKMTLGRLSPVDTVLIWESYCPFEMLKKPVGSWYSSEMKWERQKQNRMPALNLDQYYHSSSIASISLLKPSARMLLLLLLFSVN